MAIAGATAAAYLEMFPLFALYESAIWLSVLLERRLGRARVLLQAHGDW